MIELGLKVTLGYLLGAVLGSLLIGYFYGGVDIRKLGSGNAGGTNALRTQGKLFALLVMLVDVGKGILASAVIPPLVLPGVDLDPEVPRPLVLYGVAFAAILGVVHGRRGCEELPEAGCGDEASTRRGGHCYGCAGSRHFDLFSLGDAVQHVREATSNLRGGEANHARRVSDKSDYAIRTCSAR